MNLRQPYEQLIADKLRHLPAPDAASSWQQMKRMLDDDEDTRGGGRKRPPGNGWWRIGIIAFVISAGFWLYERTPAPAAQLSANNTAVPAQANGHTPAENKNSDKTQTASIDNITTLPSVPDNNTATSSAIETAAADTHSGAAVALKNAGITAAGKEPAAGATGISRTDKLPVSKAAATQADDKTNNSNSPSTAITGGFNKTGHSTGTSNKGIAIPDHAGSLAVSPTGNKFTRPAANHTAGKDLSSAEDDNSTSEEADNAMANSRTSNHTPDGHNNSGSNQSLVASEKTWLERLTGLTLSNPAPSINTSLATGDNLETNRDVSSLLNNETKKLVAKAQRDKEIAALDKKDKKFHLDLSNLFKPFSMRVDNDPWWAAGLAVNGAVTVGAQNRYNYNMNAKSSTLSDYIPSPYLQFHLNDYVYFQTELNFISPQYTPQLLLYRATSDVAAAGVPPGPVMSQQKSIYVQKLYYFNWPVSLHYSPIKNLYFSGGIQFSSFQSGLAAVEEKKYETSLGPDHASSATTTILKFKDDSIAAKIAPNEWRWQAGAEYYMNRFSVGLRYNQSLKKSINTIVTPGLAPTVNRNESLLFFVRYNLFESRNKKPDGDKN